jgi:NDP-sugar pyrophosphorylase family protein
MTRSGIVVPKPLVSVGGVPLLERNVQQLVQAGFQRIAVSVAADQGQVRSFVTDRLKLLAPVLGIEVEELVETAPLGNVGAAGLLAGGVDALLVVYADNLTTLNLERIYGDHRAHHADLTLAVHPPAVRRGAPRCAGQRPGRRLRGEAGP